MNFSRQSPFELLKPSKHSESRGGSVVSERILVVDDDRATADMQAMLISTLGYEAKAVYSGQDAVEQITTYEPDMALIDIGMPERDGYDTVAGIRQQPGGTHVILVAVTGWSRDEDKRRAYASGFDLHIAKPMRVETLKELIALLDPDGDGAENGVNHRADADPR
jgi:CheY-like chemotaxis protein